MHLLTLKLLNFVHFLTVNYTWIPHHQVWKQKGEEYRLFGGGGWVWTSGLQCRKRKRSGHEKDTFVNKKRKLLDTTNKIVVYKDKKRKEELKKEADKAAKMAAQQASPQIASLLQEKSAATPQTVQTTSTTIATTTTTVQNSDTVQSMAPSTSSTSQSSIQTAPSSTSASIEQLAVQSAAISSTPSPSSSSALITASAVTSTTFSFVPQTLSSTATSFQSSINPSVPSTTTVKQPESSAVVAASSSLMPSSSTVVPSTNQPDSLAIPSVMAASSSLMPSSSIVVPSTNQRDTSALPSVMSVSSQMPSPSVVVSTSNNSIQSAVPPVMAASSSSQIQSSSRVLPVLSECSSASSLSQTVSSSVQMTVDNLTASSVAEAPSLPKSSSSTQILPTETSSATEIPPSVEPICSITPSSTSLATSSNSAVTSFSKTCGVKVTLASSTLDSSIVHSLSTCSTLSSPSTPAVTKATSALTLESTSSTEDSSSTDCVSTKASTVASSASTLSSPSTPAATKTTSVLTLVSISSTVDNSSKDYVSTELSSETSSVPTATVGKDTVDLPDLTATSVPSPSSTDTKAVSLATENCDGLSPVVTVTDDDTSGYNGNHNLSKESVSSGSSSMATSSEVDSTKGNTGMESSEADSEDKASVTEPSPFSVTYGRYESDLCTDSLDSNQLDGSDKPNLLSGTPYKSHPEAKTVRSHETKQVEDSSSCNPCTDSNSPLPGEEMLVDGIGSDISQQNATDLDSGTSSSQVTNVKEDFPGPQTLRQESNIFPSEDDTDGMVNKNMCGLSSEVTLAEQTQNHKSLESQHGRAIEGEESGQNKASTNLSDALLANHDQEHMDHAKKQEVQPTEASNDVDVLSNSSIQDRHSDSSEPKDEQIHETEREMKSPEEKSVSDNQDELDSGHLASNQSFLSGTRNKVLHDRQTTQILDNDNLMAKEGAKGDELLLETEKESNSDFRETSVSEDGTLDEGKKDSSNLMKGATIVANEDMSIINHGDCTEPKNSLENMNSENLCNHDEMADVGGMENVTSANTSKDKITEGNTETSSPFTEQTSELTSAPTEDCKAEQSTETVLSEDNVRETTLESLMDDNNKEDLKESSVLSKTTETASCLSAAVEVCQSLDSALQSNSSSDSTVVPTISVSQPSLTGDSEETHSQPAEPTDVDPTSVSLLQKSTSSTSPRAMDADFCSQVSLSTEKTVTSVSQSPVTGDPNQSQNLSEELMDVDVITVSPQKSSSSTPPQPSNADAESCSQVLLSTEKTMTSVSQRPVTGDSTQSHSIPEELIDVDVITVSPQKSRSSTSPQPSTVDAESCLQVSQSTGKTITSVSQPPVVGDSTQSHNIPEEAMDVDVITVSTEKSNSTRSPQTSNIMDASSCSQVSASTEKKTTLETSTSEVTSLGILSTKTTIPHSTVDTTSVSSTVPTAVPTVLSSQSAAQQSTVSLPSGPVQSGGTTVSRSTAKTASSAATVPATASVTMQPVVSAVPSSSSGVIRAHPQGVVSRGSLLVPSAQVTPAKGSVVNAVPAVLNTSTGGIPSQKTPIAARPQRQTTQYVPLGPKPILPSPRPPVQSTSLQGSSVVRVNAQPAALGQSSAAPVSSIAALVASIPASGATIGPNQLIRLVTPDGRSITLQGSQLAALAQKAGSPMGLSVPKTITVQVSNAAAQHSPFTTGQKTVGTTTPGATITVQRPQQQAAQLKTQVIIKPKVMAKPIKEEKFPSLDPLIKDPHALLNRRLAKWPLRHSVKSVFALQKHERRKLGRRAGMKEVSGYVYTSRAVGVNWPVGIPRPSFKVAWRFRTQSLKTLAGAGLQLRVLHSCLKWDEINVRPPRGNSNTVYTSSGEIY